MPQPKIFTTWHSTNHSQDSRPISNRKCYFPLSLRQPALFDGINSMIAPLANPRGGWLNPASVAKTGSLRRNQVPSPANDGRELLLIQRPMKLGSSFATSSHFHFANSEEIKRGSNPKDCLSIEHCESAGDSTRIQPVFNRPRCGSLPLCSRSLGF